MVAEMPGKLGTLASEEEDEPVDGSVYLGNWGMCPHVSTFHLQVRCGCGCFVLAIVSVDVLLHHLHN